MSTATVIEPQHMRALAHGNAIRLARAAVKRRVVAGDVTVAALLAEPPECILSMTVFDLLAAQRRWGAARCAVFLGRVAIPESKTVGALTPRQIDLITRHLG